MNYSLTTKNSATDYFYATRHCYSTSLNLADTITGFDVSKDKIVFDTSTNYSNDHLKYSELSFYDVNYSLI